VRVRKKEEEKELNGNEFGCREKDGKKWEIMRVSAESRQQLRRFEL
jgi:hypothetical protein